MDANFGRFLHGRASASTLTDAASGGIVESVAISTAAASLRRAGLLPGDRLLIACELAPSSIRAYLGCLYAGIVPILVHQQDAARMLPLVRQRSDLRAVWVSNERQLRQMAAGFGDLRYICGLKRNVPPTPPIVRRADDLAVLMPTSGSTGTPRLVRVTHGNLRANTAAIVRSQQLSVSDTAMLILPLSYCFGASIVHSHLAAGGSIVLDRRFMFPNRVLSAIEQYACTTFAGVPSAFRALIHRSKLLTKPPHRLRRFLQAGGPLDGDSIRRIRRSVPGARFYIMYGATEATARITTMDAAAMEAHPESVGPPLDNLEIRIAPLNGGSAESLPVGCTGEICVRGPSVTSGYQGDRAATGEKFVDGWLMTGDLGRLDAEGFLYINGRRDEFIKMRGLRISLGEVERLVRRVEGVSDLAACAVDDHELGEAIGLVVVPRSGCDITDIESRVRIAIPAHWKIAKFAMTAALPYTSSGKLDRTRLSSLFPAESGSAA